MARQARLPSTKLVEVIVGSVVRRWIRAITQDPTDVIILSPYVTSSTADAVLEHTASNPAKLYTVFKSNLFATGASSLATLKKLVLAGHQVFHVDRLHAKIVLTKRLATVGSQNLTAGGCTNREVTVLLEDPKDMAELRDGLTPWLQHAKPVTIEQILDVEGRLVSLRKALKAFSRLSEDIDTDTAQRHEQRQREQKAEEDRQRLRAEAEAEAERRRVDAEQRLQAEAEAERRRVEAEQQRKDEAQRIETAARRQRMQDLLNQTAISCPIQTRIIQYPYVTLVHRHNKDRFTLWQMPNGEHVQLRHRHRYLLVARDTGRISWPALNHTRLTQFGTGLIDEKFTFYGQTIILDFKEFTAPNRPDANLRLHLRMQDGDPYVVVLAWFDVQGIKLHEPTVSTTENSNYRTEWIIKQLKNRLTEFKEILINCLLHGFKYSLNRKGTKASTFLGRERQNFNIRLHRLGKHYFLVAE